MSDNFESSDEDIELIDYDNEITRNLWMPARLSCIASTMDADSSTTTRTRT